MTVRRVFSAVVFLLVLILGDRILTFGLDRMYSQTMTGALSGLANYALAQRDKELIVFGSSRAVYHIDPDILTAKLGVSAFNAGSPGMGVQYARAIESLMIARGTTARYFILNMDIGDLWGVDYARLGRLAPFWGQSETLDAMLVKISPLARLKLMWGTYRYNSILIPLLTNWIDPSMEHTGNGFRLWPKDQRPNLEAPIEDPNPHPGPTCRETEEMIRAFARDARERGITTVMVVGPLWRPNGLRAEDRIGRKRIAEITQEEGIPYVRIDQETHPVFLDPNLFGDVSHLNNEGARIFSSLLAEALMAIVKPERS